MVAMPSEVARSALASLDTRGKGAHILRMTPRRLTIVHALALARRRKGITAGELAEVSGCALRTAQDLLRDLAADGVLEAEQPERKGKRRGDWRNTYRLARGARP